MAVIGRNGRGEIVRASNVRGPMASKLIADWFAKRKGTMPLPIRDTSHLHAEIERLTAENERLRAALRRIADDAGYGGEGGDWASDVARNTLNDGTQPPCTASQQNALKEK